MIKFLDKETILYFHTDKINMVVVMAFVMIIY